MTNERPALWRLVVYRLLLVFVLYPLLVLWVVVEWWRKHEARPKQV